MLPALLFLFPLCLLAATCDATPRAPFSKADIRDFKLSVSQYNFPVARKLFHPALLPARDFVQLERNAAVGNKLSVVEFLRERDAGYDDCPLIFAEEPTLTWEERLDTHKRAQYGDLPVDDEPLMRAFVAANAKQGEHPLVVAAAHGSAEVVRHFMSRRLSRCYCVASKSGCFIRGGVNRLVHAQALRAAAQAQQWAIVKMLFVEFGVSPAILCNFEDGEARCVRSQLLPLWALSAGQTDLSVHLFAHPHVMALSDPRSVEVWTASAAAADADADAGHFAASRVPVKTSVERGLAADVARKYARS